jgi:hypothetical protein
MSIALTSRACTANLRTPCWMPRRQGSPPGDRHMEMPGAPCAGGVVRPVTPRARRSHCCPRRTARHTFGPGADGVLGGPGGHLHGCRRGARAARRASARVQKEDSCGQARGCTGAEGELMRPGEGLHGCRRRTRAARRGSARVQKGSSCGQAEVCTGAEGELVRQAGVCAAPAADSADQGRVCAAPAADSADQASVCGGTDSELAAESISAPRANAAFPARATSARGAGARRRRWSSRLRSGHARAVYR